MGRAVLASVPKRTCPPTVIVVVAILTNFLAGGFVFGFSSLVAILRVSGAYSGLCEDGAKGGWVPNTTATAPSSSSSSSSLGVAMLSATADSCPARELALGRIFLFGSVAAIGMTLPHGLIMDRFGPKMAGGVSFLLFLIGLVLFAFSTDAFDGRGAGFALLGAGAPGFIMSTFHVAALTPQRTGLAMAAINGAYDSSSIVLQIFLAIFLSQEHVVGDREASRGLLRNMCLVYAGAVLLPLAIAYGAVMPKHRIEPASLEAEGEDEDGGGEHAKKGGANVSAGGGDDDASSTAASGGLAPLEVQVHDDNNDGDTSNRVLQAKGMVFRELSTVRWVLFTLWFCSNLLRFSYYLSSIGPALAAIEIAQTGSQVSSGESRVVEYLTIFGSILPLGALCVPFVGAFIDRVSTHNSILAVIGVALLHSAASFVDVLEAQVTTFCLFTVFRSIFFGVATTFAVKLFPPAALGRVYGFTTLVAAGISTLQYPLLDLGLEMETGFRVPNILICVTTVVSGLPLYFYMRATVAPNAGSEEAAVTEEETGTTYITV